jgi:hypothetical protein
MTDEKRKGWLAGLVGTDKADEVITDTEEAASKLDEAGVTRKQMEDEEEATPPPAEETPEEAPPEDEEKQEDGDVVDEAAVTLAQQVFDAAGGDLSAVTPEQLAALLADALRPAVDEEPAMEETAAEAPAPEREEELAGKSLPLQVTAKDLADAIGQMAKDQGEIARHYQAIAEDVATAKALVPVVEKLVETLNEIQGRLDNKPRIASRDPATVVDSQTEQGKAIKGAAEKGIREEKRSLGIPVKDTPK